MTTSTVWKPSYYDIGVNFSDGMFQGYYHGSSKKKHPEDVDRVIQRAHLFNVKKMLITASSIQESEEHFELCKKYPEFKSTVGVHPCTVAREFFTKDSENNYTETPVPDLDSRLQKLKDIVKIGVEKGYIGAFGEIGLDYDRLHFSTQNQQVTMFKKQLEVIASLKELEIPLFLHMRSACDDFIDILKPFLEDGSIKKGHGVVHSFTGSEDELKKIIELGFYVSVNGCSLKTEDNLRVASLIPRSRLLIETDAPWCEIRKSHASHKFVSPYPNKYYPEIIVNASNEETSLENKEEEKIPLELNGKEKKIKKSKSPTPQKEIKLDPYVPFPSIKVDNFEKHKKAVESGNESDIFFTQPFGPNSYPLIKSRNEPIFVGQVAEIMASLYGIKDDEEIEKFLDEMYENSVKLFG